MRSENIKASDKTFIQRIYSCFEKAHKPAVKTILWLLRLMIPISFGVMLLDYSGILLIIADFVAPFMQLLGLRGEAALVLLTGALLNIYSAVAIIQTIEFSMREITIMGLMILIAHSLIMESAIQKKTGSNPLWMTALRILAAIAGGLLLDLLMPVKSEIQHVAYSAKSASSFYDVLYQWAINTIRLSLRITFVIYALNVLQKILDEFSITLLLSKIMSPVLRVFGLPEHASFLWVIANIIGLSWGSGIMIEQVEKGKISKEESDILNHHIAVSHSLLEDTTIFVSIGVSAVWLLFPRFFLAFIVVWIYRLVYLKRKSLSAQAR